MNTTHAREAYKQLGAAVVLSVIGVVAYTAFVPVAQAQDSGATERAPAVRDRGNTSVQGPAPAQQQEQTPENTLEQPERGRNFDTGEPRTLPATREATPEQAQDARTGGENMREQGLERRDQALQSAQERVAANVARILDRLLAALDRFENLVDRSESRIEKFAARNIDTSEPEAHIENARTALDEARTDIMEMQEELRSPETAEQPRVFFGQIGSIVRDTLSTLREAHRAVIDAVRSMRDIADQLGSQQSPESDNAATSTEDGNSLPSEASDNASNE